MIKNKDASINAHVRGFGCDMITRWNDSLQELGIKGSVLQPVHFMRNLDVFVLRIISLIICRGEVEDKVDYFIQLISSSGRTEYNNVNWENVPLLRAIRIIFYFIIVVPYRFLKDKREEEVFKKILFHTGWTSDNKQ